MHIYPLFEVLRKGMYVFLREHEDGSVTEIELRDANFLQQEFPSKGEICRDSVYEMNESSPCCSVE